MKAGYRNRIAQDVEALRRRVGDDGVPARITGEGYGGVVALHFAARFPHQVASVELTEPADLISLFDDGLDTPDARRVRRLHACVVRQSGSAFGRWYAARRLVDFRFGAGTWKSLGARRKARHVAELPQAAAELDALMSAGARIGNFAVLTMPVTIRCRTTAPRPLRRVCERLHERLPNSRLAWIPVEGRDECRVHVTTSAALPGCLESCAA